MRRVKIGVASVFILLLNLAWFGGIQAETRFYKPYVLAKELGGDITQILEEVRTALNSGGFSVVGENNPYSGAHTLVVTNATLKQVASQSEYGGYGSVLRVAVTKSGDTVQVSYTNPEYMAISYRMAASLIDVSESLATALGRVKEFGSDTGLTEFTLSKYHYMMFMPYFTDQLKLAKYDDHGRAIEAVESGLAAEKSGTKKVYRVDPPGKNETLFGVALTKGEGADTTVMATTDIAPLKHTAHLPYEMLVSDGKVYTLHGKFRIAQSFPDLTMGTFMKISDAPDAIEEALRAAAGGN